VVVDLAGFAQIQSISPRYMLSSAPCCIAPWFLATTLTGGWSKCAQLNKQLYAFLTVPPPSVISNSSSCLHVYIVSRTQQWKNHVCNCMCTDAEPY
jgi:hypothetical protein